MMPAIAQKLFMINSQNNNIFEQQLQQQNYQQQQQQQQQWRFIRNPSMIYPDEWNALKYGKNRIWPTKRHSLIENVTGKQQKQQMLSTINNPITANNNNNNSMTIDRNWSSNRHRKPYIVYVNNEPIVPTSIPFWNSTTTPTPQHLNCLQQCLTTPEFNPVCASNRQTYHNEQKFHCAKNCGANIQIVHRGNCE